MSSHLNIICNGFLCSIYEINYGEQITYILKRTVSQFLVSGCSVTKLLKLKFWYPVFFPKYMTTSFNDFFKFWTILLRLPATKFEMIIVLKIETLNQALNVLSIFYAFYTWLIITIDVKKMLNEIIFILQRRSRLLSPLFRFYFV